MERERDGRLTQTSVCGYVFIVNFVTTPYTAHSSALPPSRSHTHTHEVIVPALQPKEQLPIRLLCNRRDRTVRQHELVRDDVVDGEPVLVRLPRVPAAEREARDADAAHAPTDHVHAVRLERGVHVVPHEPCTDLCSLGGGVVHNLVETRERDVHAGGGGEAEVLGVSAALDLRGKMGVSAEDVEVEREGAHREWGLGRAKDLQLKERRA